MKRILLSLVLIAAVSAAVVSTGAYFVDRETSTGNTFNAGNLDLKVDGGDVNVVKFTTGMLSPGSQPNGTWKLENVGNVAGYLDLHNIVVTDDENGRIEPEVEAGDPTEGVGELSSVLDCRIMLDQNGDGWLQTGDVILYEGKASGIPADLESNISIPAGGTVYINAIFNWFDNGEVADSRAMTDIMNLGLKFELGQTTGQ